mmetsp:Transcript_120488/g.179962  ORF Transcript_120488/g.179962 Transcript_120488/m.179962 type:complete len:97 (-) Transcript_120488:8-298(-)
MARCGGIKAATEATEETQTILNGVKGSIEEKLGKTLDTLEAKTVATQVVAGTNFFIKAHIGSGEYIHARIFRSLSNTTELHSIQTGKTADDELSYF